MKYPGYERNNGIPELRLSVVAFLDVLGTSELAAADQAQETLEALDRALKSAREQSGIDEDDNWFHASWFSDNLSVSAPIDGLDRDFQESTFGFLVVTLVWLQYMLAIDGFFTRGGLVVDNQFSDDDVNFGPALVAAVAAEKAAVHPRVALSDDACDFIDRHFRDHFDLDENPFHLEFMRDESGVVFLSYLCVAFEADDDEQALDILTRHRDAVAGKLEAYSGVEKVLAKYRWSAEYHNQFCSRYWPASPELLIAGMEAAPHAPYVPAAT